MYSNPKQIEDHRHIEVCVPACFIDVLPSTASKVKIFPKIWSFSRTKVELEGTLEWCAEGEQGNHAALPLATILGESEFDPYRP